jgi:hypothetical protein
VLSFTDAAPLIAMLLNVAAMFRIVTAMFPDCCVLPAGA